MIYVIFLKGSWLKGYITGSPFFLHWQLPLERRGKSTDKVVRPGLHSASVLFCTFLLLLLRRGEETPPLSAQGQGTLSQAAPARWLLLLLLLLFNCLPYLPRSRKEKPRVPALILLAFSSVIPAPVEASIDQIPARSSLSIS